MTPEQRKNLTDFGIHFTEGADIGPKAAIRFEPKIAFQCRLEMHGSIGAYTYIRGPGRLGSGVKQVGRYCSIAPGLTAGDGSHPLDWLSTSPFQYAGASAKRWLDTPEAFPKYKPAKKSAVFIGNDVWIGAGVTILPGVKIGDGAVIGAGSVVTKDVEPYAIVAGVPAKTVRFRIEGELRERLIALQWWQYDANDLVGVPFDTPSLAVAEIERRVQSGDLQPAAYKTVMVYGTNARRPDQLQAASVS